MCSVDSDRMQRQLFETERLGLTSAIWMCQTMESTASDLQLLTATKPTESEESVAALGGKELGEKDGEERLQQEKFKRESPTKWGYTCGARWGQETGYALDVDYRTGRASVQPMEGSVPNVMVLTILRECAIRPPHTFSGRGQDSVYVWFRWRLCVFDCCGESG